MSDDLNNTAEVASDPVLQARKLSRLLKRPVAVFCLLYIALIIGVAIIAPIVMPHVANQHAGDLASVLKGPSSEHVLGTDTLGRDVLARLLVGTRVTIVGVGEALAVVILVGVPLGVLAGFSGGWIDRSIMWLADMAFAVPAVVVVIAVLSVFPSSMLAGMCTFGALAAPGLMRVVRSATLPVRDQLYVQAARVSGLSRFYIMTRHVLPRIAGPVIVQASILSAIALLVQSGLAFLNLLVAAPAPSWGGMVADGSTVLLRQPWLVWPPGLVIALTVLALGLLGDVLRDTTTESWARPRLGSDHSSKQRGRAHGARSQPVEAEGAVLTVNGLTVELRDGARSRLLIDDVTFDIGPGETVGVVGESGCGKSITGAAILGLLPSGGQVADGSVCLNGVDLTELTERELRSVRGKEVALISQDPMVSLNPVLRVGTQLAESLRQHRGLRGRAARSEVVDLLSSVNVPNPERVARAYPHELSGGLAQRVAIARALAGRPSLLIADEPTTALDVTVQAAVLDELRQLQHRHKMSILLITHDWGVVADLCDRVVVMYAGQVVERADADAIFAQPLHPYSDALQRSNPHGSAGQRRLPVINGSVPQPGRWPQGCHFHPRCEYATDICATTATEMSELADRQTRCVRYREVYNGR